MSITKTVMCVVLWAWLPAALGLAQSTTGGGTILGTVKDATGAVVPGAKVLIQHVETGVVTQTASNSDGIFSTPSINIGRYRVRVEAPGMKAWESEVLLETGRRAEINPVLSPGQVNETVTVSETIPLVSTTEPTDGSTLDAQRIAELPINGRDMNTLLGEVTPGVEQVIDVNGGIRAGGLMAYSTNYMQDGAASNNREFGGSMNLQGLESVGEVRVETSTGSAKYSSATSVIVTTKSGTNRMRFSAYETVRNNAFGVARARQDVSYSSIPYQTPKLIRNEFGGSVGGPVYIPKVYDGRNRTFFFFSREGVELRQGITKTFTVPTMDMRNGDFSGLIDSVGRKITIYDPASSAVQTAANGRQFVNRVPFTNNTIPSTRQSPLAKYIWGITPTPTDVTNPLVTSNLKVAVPTNGYPNMSDNPTTIRVDHTTGKDSFFVKTNGGVRSADFLGTGSSTGAPTANKEANVTYLIMRAIAGAASWTHMFTPAFFVETVANRTWQSSRTVNGVEQKDWAAAMGLPNPRGQVGWPQITGVQFMSYVEGDNRRSLRSVTTNASQNYTWIKGTHNIGFGWNLHREQQALLPDQGAISGASAFSSLSTSLMSSTSGSMTSATAVAQTGSDAANFYLGSASTYSIYLSRGIMRVAERNYGLYIQDNYKVTNRLTLTPGLRWDINPAFIDKEHVLNTFDLASHSVLLPEPLEYYYKLGVTTPAVVQSFQNVGVTFKSAAELGRSSQIFPNNFFDLGPRIGFAYRFADGPRQWVVRGGYGIYYSPIPMRTLLAQFSGMMPFKATFSYNPNSASQSPDGYPNYLLRNAQVYTAGVNTAHILDNAGPNQVGRGQSVVAMGDLPSMRIQEWNLAVEKQVGAASVVRLAYTGKHGVRADQLNDINPTQTDYVWYMTTGNPLPTGTYSSVARRPYDQNAYTTVRILEKTGFINTSTLTAEYQRRFTKGLGFQVFHTMTNAFRAAGNSFRDSIGGVASAYLPGTVPEGKAELNRFLNYARDTGIPKHRTRWNWNYDLPFGKGRRFFRNAPKAVNTMIGGWKFSGSGTFVSSWFAMPTGNWGEMGKFEVYGKKYPILDCRSTPSTATDPKDERCYEGYLYYNGYISWKNIDSRNAAGLRNGVFGLPADYKPAMKPIIPWPEGGKTGDAGSADWDTNYVYIKLSNGVTQRVTADTGLHPWRNQYRLGPFNWTTDASLLKFFNITERIRLRANFDVFNLFNTQGLNTPGSDGIVTLQNSYSGFGMRPRQVQVTMRLEW